MLISNGLVKMKLIYLVQITCIVLQKNVNSKGQKVKNAKKYEFYKKYLKNQTSFDYNEKTIFLFFKDRRYGYYDVFVVEKDEKIELEFLEK